MGDIGRTGRRLTLLALMGLVAVLAFWAFFGSTSADYVGSEKCGDCHDGNYETWRETLHGIDFADPEEYSYNKYTRGGNDTTGEMGSCAPCHMVGWNDEANGGVIESEPWNSTHNLPLGSIGCENCHGPGGDHVDDRSGNPEYMQATEFTYSLSCAGWSTVANDDRPGSTFDGETIMMCHDGGRMGGIPDEEIPGYYDSVHAGGIGSSSPKGNPDCYHCMAANGFISVTIEGEDPPEADDFEEVDGEYFVDGELVVYGIYCGVCHDPHEHSEETHFQLRAPEDEICELCHYNTHEFPDTHVRHGTTEFRNGLQGKDVPVIEFMSEVSCPECHMFGTGHRAEVIIVGHSFEIVPQACTNCHSMYTNETAQAWIDLQHAQYNDWVAAFGDGETSGILLEAHERMVWAMDNDLWTEDLNMTYLEAEWNYALVTQDGSMMAHNPEFGRTLFEVSMEKFEEVLENSEWGGVEGTLTWDNGDAIEGAKIMDGATTAATTDADGKYFFWADSGTRNFLVEDADGNLLGSINADVTTMQNVTKDVAFEEPSTGGGGDNGDDEETDTMTYVFIGIIVLLIIILIVVAMMGKKE